MQIHHLLSVLLTVCAVNVMADVALPAAGTNYCSNGEKIPSTQTAWASKGCDPASSAGIKSSHNCKNAGGKYYLCKKGNEWACSAVRNFPNAEKGECFK